MVEKRQRDQQHQHNVESVFNQIVDKAAHDTHRKLDELCGDDTLLRSDVERLLAADEDQLAGFMEVAATIQVANQGIEGYRIIEPIGEGGMGLVFLAEQKNPKRNVALKTLKPGFVSGQQSRRFEFEGQTLGQLQHPGIAQIYEAGSTTTRSVNGDRFSQPFIAMELIDGSPITEFVRTAGLDLRSKLMLILSVCEAIQYAHRRGVVHRDLKPSNIMVTREGEPKIVDFGVARLIHQNPQAVESHTLTGQLIGTIAYMSPEQMAGHSAKVDTRSDVYSLGVILYQVLSGRYPYEIAELSLPDSMQKITHESPIPISKHHARLKGDVETIVNKAMAKDLEQRYQSVAELATDIQRFVDNRPIAARRPSPWYACCQFAKRNKIAVAAALLIMATLITSGVMLTDFAIKKSIALEDARQNIAIANHINDFINQDLLMLANPEFSSQRDPTIRVALDAAAERIDERFKNMPQVEASIRYTIGRSYQGLGVYDRAATHLKMARELFSSEFGAGDERTLNATNALGQVYIDLWELEAAEGLCRECVSLAESKLGESHELTARAHSTYGNLLRKRGRLNEAEEQFRRAVALWDQYQDLNHDDRIRFQNNLAVVLRDQKKHKDAESVIRDVVARWETRYGRDHLNTAQGLECLGSVLRVQSGNSQLSKEDQRKKLDEAALAVDEVLQIRQKFLPEIHPLIARSYYAIALINRRQGQLEESAEMHLKALGLRRKIYGNLKHLEILDSMNGLAGIRAQQGKLEDAKLLFEKAYFNALETVGSEHARTHLYFSNLCRNYRQRADVVGLQELIEDYRERLSERSLAFAKAELSKANQVSANDGNGK